MVLADAQSQENIELYKARASCDLCMYIASEALNRWVHMGILKQIYGLEGLVLCYKVAKS